MVLDPQYPWYLELENRAWTKYDTLPVLTVDFETTNLDKGDSRNPDNRIVLTAAKSDSGSTLVGSSARTLLEASSGSPLILVAHNAKFELGWLNRSGIDTTQWLPWDTMVAEYVVAGNRKVPLDLDSVSRRYGLGGKGRIIANMMRAGISPEEQPARLLQERAIWDVDHTYELFKLQVPLLAAKGLTRVMFTRSIVTPVLAHIEPYGMELDGPRVMEEYETLVKRRAELKAELTTIARGGKLKGPQLVELVYGTPSEEKPHLLGFEELTDYKGRPIRTDTGRPSTAADTLVALKARTPEQKRFVKLYREYNKIDSAITKNIEFFRFVVEERNGRFQANFNQTRTQTHRLSSSGKRLVFSDGKARSVQFQNFPRKYKRLFRAPAGKVLFEADGMGLEFRTGGSLARDPQVLADVQAGADVHRYTASIMLRKPESEVTKDERNDSKEYTFKPMYGGTRGTKREQEYYEAFRTKYKVMFETQRGWTHEVLEHGRLRTASGLIFYWPGTSMSRTGYITNTPSIFNYPVQSFATAEIIPVSVVYTFWEARRRGLDARIVNTIHDSVISEVAEGDVDKYQEVVVESFLDRTYEYIETVYGIDLYVPLGVETKAGTNWGEGEEIKTSYPYRRGQ